MIAMAYVKLPPAPEGDDWDLRPNPRPPSRFVRPNTVHAALLACLKKHPSGATMDQCQAAVDEMVKVQRLDPEAHRALLLMRWASANRGVGFRCRNGLITKVDE